MIEMPATKGCEFNDYFEDLCILSCIETGVLQEGREVDIRLDITKTLSWKGHEDFAKPYYFKTALKGYQFISNAMCSKYGYQNDVLVAITNCILNWMTSSQIFRRAEVQGV